MIILTIIQSHHHQDHHNFYHLTIFYNAITLIDVQGGYGQVNDQKTRKRPSHENYDVDDFINNMMIMMKIGTNMMIMAKFTKSSFFAPSGALALMSDLSDKCQVCVNLLRGQYLQVCLVATLA